jgi:hypothetical protein
MVVFFIDPCSTKESVFVNGKTLLNKNSPSLYHEHRFEVEGDNFIIKVFALNNLIPISVVLYVNGEKIKRFKSKKEIPFHIKPEWLMRNKMTNREMPSWYWIFIIINAAFIFFVQPGKYLQIIPPFIIVMTILRLARTNPGKYTVEKRVFIFLFLTVVNLALFVCLRAIGW